MVCNKQKDHSSSSSCLPVRYCLALNSSIVMFTPVGTRKSLALILTHITASELSSVPVEIIFTNCTVFNMSRDLHIEMGEDTMFLLHSLYSATLVLMRFPASLLAVYVLPARMITACLGVASVLTLCLPYAIVQSIPLLFVLRGIQGVLLGVLVPCIMSILPGWTTETDSGLVYSLCFEGLYLAPAVSAVLSGGIMCYVNWNGILYIFGRRIPWWDILTYLPVWSIFMAFFSRHFVCYLIVVAHPQYFMDAVSISIADISLLTTIPHIGLTLFAMLGGLILDKLIKKGLSTILSRKIIFTIGHLSEGLSLLSLYFTDDWRTAVTFISVGVSVGGVADPIVYRIPSTGRGFEPRTCRGESGIVCTGALGSFVSTFIAAFLCSKNQGLAGWQKLYLVTGLVSSSSVLFFNIWAQAKLQPWAHEAHSMVSEMEKLLPQASETDNELSEPSEKDSLRGKS